MNKVFVFCENYNREFKTKLELSFKLLEINNVESIYIGDQRLLYLLGKFRLLNNGIVVIKSAQRYIRKYLEKIKKDNVLLLQDEEGLVSIETSKGKSVNRNDKYNLSLIDEIFCWNQEEKESFLNVDAGLENKISICGNIRTSIYTDYQKIYKREIQEIKEKYEDYIFIVGNGKIAFSSNHEPPVSEIIKNNVKKYTQGEEYLNTVLAWSENMIYSYFHLFDFLARLKKDDELCNTQIVYRPHPGENKDIISKLFEDLGNIYIEDEYSVIPWLAAAKVVIGSGTTTLVESLNLSKPTFSLVFDSNNKKYKNVTKMLPNELSIMSEDGEQLLESIKDFSKDKLSDSYRKVYEICQSKIDTYQIYAEKVEKLTDVKTKSSNNKGSDILYKLITASYDWFSRLQASKDYKVNHNKKFPENALKSDIKCIQEMAKERKLKIKIINSRLIKLYK